MALEYGLAPNDRCDLVTPSQFSEDLQASCALVNLRVKLGMEPGAKVKDIVERAAARIEELEQRVEVDRLYLECSRERIVSAFMGTVGP